MLPLLLALPNRALPALLPALACGGYPVPAHCHARPSQPPVATTALLPAALAASAATPPPLPKQAPIKLKVEAGKPPYRMLPGKTMHYHRYVGRMGNQPVVVTLLANPEKNDMTAPLSGGYYAARRGQTTELSFRAFDPHRRLQFTAYPTGGAAEHWQAQQPLGPRLTGTVAAAGKPRRRFVLQENYAEAVPLVIRSATMYGRPVVAEFGDRGEPGQFTGSYQRQYVQLLGAAAQRPELQRAFPSRPAQVRARLRQEFRQGEADLANINEYMGISLNDYGLLSYGKYISDFGAGSSHPQNILKSWSYDLHTGRRLTLASLLRPGSKRALLKLALHYMDASYLTDIIEWYNNPRGGAEGLTYLNLEEVFGLTPDGLTLDADLGPHSMPATTITIPYAALRPLLRPGTPLNRVLVAQRQRPVL